MNPAINPLSVEKFKSNPHRSSFSYWNLELTLIFFCLMSFPLIGLFSLFYAFYWHQQQSQALLDSQTPVNQKKPTSVPVPTQQGIKEQDFVTPTVTPSQEEHRDSSPHRQQRGTVDQKSLQPTRQLPIKSETPSPKHLPAISTTAELISFPPTVDIPQSASLVLQKPLTPSIKTIKQEQSLAPQTQTTEENSSVAQTKARVPLSVSLPPPPKKVRRTIPPPLSSTQKMPQEITLAQAEAQGHPLVKIEVDSGFGINLNFTQTDVVIKKAWLADPSQIALTVDGSLCPTDINHCQAASQIIHLKQRLPKTNLGESSFDGSTLLTLIAETPSHETKILTFLVTLGARIPQFSTINVLPDASLSSPPLPPIKKERQQSLTAEGSYQLPSSTLIEAEPSLLTSSAQRKTSFQKANQLRLGLSRARRARLIPYHSPLRKQLEQGIDLFKQGSSIAEVSQTISVAVSEIEAVLHIGSVQHFSNS